MLSKKIEYVLAGALALYIVFATRPAPAFIASALASPIAQVAALAVVIYVGATQSLVVAIVAGLALVLSTPSREYMTDKKPEKKKTKKDDKLKDASEKVSAAAVPTESSKEPDAAGQTVTAAGSKENTTSALKTEHFANVSA